MGDFSVRCAVSDMVLGRNDKCVLFPVLIEHTHDGFPAHTPNKYVRMIGFPMKGEYDTYGFIEKLENPGVITLNKQIVNLTEKQEDECEYGDDFYHRQVLVSEIFKEDHVEQYDCNKHFHNRNVHFIGKVLINRDVYDYVLNICKKRGNRNYIGNFKNEIREIETHIIKADFERKIVYGWINGHCDDIGIDYEKYFEKFSTLSKVMETSDTTFFSFSMKRFIRRHLYTTYANKNIVSDEFLDYIQEINDLYDSLFDLGKVLQVSSSNCAQSYDLKCESEEMKFIEFVTDMRKKKYEEVKKEWGE